ncbi:MAG: hypothetical protein AB7G06_06410 [Bdellovibrionales bacterium]
MGKVATFSPRPLTPLTQRLLQADEGDVMDDMWTGRTSPKGLGLSLISEASKLAKDDKVWAYAFACGLFGLIRLEGQIQAAAPGPASVCQQFFEANNITEGQAELWCTNGDGPEDRQERERLLRMIGQRLTAKTL